MAFEKKTWTDRVAEFINRRILTKEDGTTEIVTVARSEGEISVEGDAFNAETMNDLEQRVADEFSSLNETLANMNADLSDKAPASHASTEMTYGIGNASKYGHAKLSNTYKSIVGTAADGVAASQSAVYGVYNELMGVDAKYEPYTISSANATSGTNNIVKYQGANISSGVYLIIGFCNMDDYITVVLVDANSGTVTTLLKGDASTIVYSFTTAGYLRVKQSSGAAVAIRSLIFAL